MQRKQKTVLLEVQSCSKWTTNRVTSVRKRPPEAVLQNCGFTPRPGLFSFCGSIQMADSYPFAFILEGVPSASQTWPPRRLVTPPLPPVSRHLQGLRPLLEPPHHVIGSASHGSQPPAPSHPHPLPSRQPPKFSAFPTISPSGLSYSLLCPQHDASHHPLKGADHPNIASAHHLPEQENPCPAGG